MIGTTTIEAACDLVTDGTHYTPRDVGKGIPFLTVKDVTDESLDFVGCSFMTEDDYETAKSGNSASQRGDVLFSKDGTVGKVHVVETDQPFAVLSSLAILRPKKDAVDAKFFGYVLRSPPVIDDALKRRTGSAIRRVILSDLKNVRIPLPPLDEQRRIAAILDKANALRAKRRAALAQLDTLTQSIFLDMFGNPATNPNEMCQLPLGDLIKLKSGEFLPGTAMVDSGPYPVLGGNGINGFHDRYMFEDPQVVIGRVGVYCGCVHASPPKSWVTDNALYVSEWSPRLRFEYLLHALTHARLNQYASQSGQPLVSGSRIYPVAIVVPPAELQIAFEERITSTGKLKRLYDAAISKVDVLFAALQHRAFQGRL